jgi:hydrogenase maturation protein HypF
MERARINVTGIVQGVGFRPFVYRVAERNGIKGYVRNSGRGVEIVAVGGKERIRTFLDELRKEGPPLSRIDRLEVRAGGEREHGEFRIVESEGGGGSESVLPPDVALCETCRVEMGERENRRYGYPFTVCTDCGPRFTILERLPYDRENTTMAPFRMCRSCAAEYRDPADRRFHAEPVCCPVCGPRYTFYRGREVLEGGDPIRGAAEALEGGAIVAMKGVGGTHLAAKVGEDGPISRMREALRRPEKPFAVMARDLKAIRGFAKLGRGEEALLSSFRRPIVLLRKKRGGLAEGISPGLDTVGVLLPYSGVHHLLFRYSKEPAFVMTSANLPGEPMALAAEEILSLGAEYSLIHNRRIKHRCDDSVIKLVDGKGTFLRRSRGYVPEALELEIPEGKSVLAMGAEREVTACFLKGKRAFLTQHIGNTTNPKSLEFLEGATKNLMELAGGEEGEIDAVAVDLHPAFPTGRLGRELAGELGSELVECQHHKAHIAALMAEKGLEEVVGIGVDGLGFGEDGSVWGGEVITVRNGEFQRVAGLMPQPMPGGDLAARYPARMLCGILAKKRSASEILDALRGQGFRGAEEVRLMERQLEGGYNTPLTTSAGRVLDAVAALLGVCYERTYEGEPAMKLEALARGGQDGLEIPVPVVRAEGRWVLNTTEMIDAALQWRLEGKKGRDIAASFQRGLAEGLATLAVEAAAGGDLPIGLSGGVAYNDAIVGYIRRKVEGEGLRFVTHETVPPGDGGISLGQAVMARLGSSRRGAGGERTSIERVDPRFFLRQPGFF